MAIATGFQAFSIPSNEVWFGDVLETSSTRIRISDGVRIAIYKGEFSYNIFGDVFGTLDSITEFNHNGILYSVTGINADANPIYEAIQIQADAFKSASLILDGDDTINASDGDDDLFAFDGDDVLNGNGGNDILRGGNGMDTIDGGDGNDLIRGGFGNDNLSGGLGSDQIFGDSGNDTLLGEGSSDQLDGGSGDDVLVGGAGSDILNGGVGADRLNGGEGDDILRGGAGNDTLRGNIGNDLLDGGDGDDNLYGGADADTFVFGPNGGLDTVFDFEVGIDTINVEEFRISDLMIQALGSDDTEILGPDGTRTILRNVDPTELSGNNVVPMADLSLIVNQITTDKFGNGFNGQSAPSGTVVASFQHTDTDLLLTFDGYDIDHGSEVELFLNGVSQGFLAPGPNNGLQAQSFALAAADQVVGINELWFDQQDNPAFKWGVTDLTLTTLPGDLLLKAGVTETGSFGNGFNGATDTDGRITAGFIGTDSDLILDFQGYDIDHGGEVELFLNGASQGFLTPGPNNGEQRQQFVIEAGDQQAGANLLAFEQRDNPAFKWGFTEVTLVGADTVDQALALDRQETSPYGNGFNGTTDADGSITFGFAGTDEDLDFTFQGFDIDHGGEVELFLNDVSQGFLSAGPNNGLQAQSFAIAATDQVEGLNELRFDQQDNPAFKWGVTDLLLEIA